jgi:hypothetical protein
MADDENIYVDAGEPALLHDGSVHTEYHTVADAKTAWDRLPPARRRSATIEANRHVYKERQINRLHCGPNPMQPTPLYRSSTLLPIFCRATHHGRRPTAIRRP